MKKIIITIILLITSSALAQTKEEVQILHNIDSICADTWCSNPDYTFTFEKLTINGEDAILHFTTYEITIRKNVIGEEREHLTKYADDTCNFKLNPKENLIHLTDDIMEAIGDCLIPME